MVTIAALHVADFQTGKTVLVSAVPCMCEQSFMRACISAKYLQFEFVFG